MISKCLVERAVACVLSHRHESVTDERSIIRVHTGCPKSAFAYRYRVKP